MLALILVLVLLLVAWGGVIALELPLWIGAVATALVLVVYGGALAYGRYRARKAAREIERSLASQAEQFAQGTRPDEQAQIRALQEELDRAVDALKQSKLARGRQGALYALPWYVIIGPPGAGKSTALRASGLKFPHLGSGGGIKGVGGTRNCDWWLTNEAVLLDTAGRYATEDDDREEWLAFLDMLKRTRPRSPINGLLVAVSATEVGGGSDGELEILGRRIRERIDEVMQRLGMVVPVYVLFTKCDLIPGFIETFQDLRKGERDQVWGFTVPLGERSSEAESHFERHFTRLVQVVERRAVGLMGQQRSTEQRASIHEFGQQLEALGPRMGRLLGEVFVENIYTESPVLRGVYFTSGTQEGSPVDRVMSAMAAAFGLAPQTRPRPRVAEARSYFLGDLFRSVVFADQHLAARSEKEVRRLQWLRLGVAALLVLVAVGVGGLPIASYLRNKRLVSSTEQAVRGVAEFRAHKAAGPVPFEVLEPVRVRLAELQRWQQHGAPWSYGFGLYQGQVLLPRVQDFYTSTLRGVLLEPIVQGLHGEIEGIVKDNETLGARPTVDDHARLYAALRAYLLLTGPKEPGQPELNEGLQKELGKVLVDAWMRSTKDAAPARRSAMATHVGAYLQLLAADSKLGFARNAGLVRRARDVLDRVPTTQLAVDRVVAEVDALGWDLSLDKLLGASGLPVSGTGRVRGAFTRRAWDEYLKDLFAAVPEELLGDPWVLQASSKGDGGDTVQARLCKLRTEYFSRYIDQWKRFLGAVRVEEPAENVRAVTVLQDLTRGQPPPLERLMRTVAYNVDLTEKEKKKDNPKAEEGESPQSVLERIRGRLKDSPVGSLLGGDGDPCAEGNFIRDADVRNALRGFYGFGAVDEGVGGGDGGGQLTSIQIYQEQLAYVRDALQTYMDDPTSAEPLLARLQGARTRVRGLIETQEVGWRPRFDALLWPAINGASSSSTSALAGEKGGQWCTSVVLPFERTLRGKYPFVSGGQDASLADVAEFYRAGSGVLWAFYDSALKRDVPRVGDRYQPRGGASVGSMYNADLVGFLERSQLISSVMFPPRAEQPQVDFEVRVRPSPGIASILLTIDGQEVDFHNGPEKWVRIRWPGTQGKPGVVMRVRGATVDERVYGKGEWGLFRFLDAARISAVPGERFFTGTWTLNTQNRVRVDFRPARAQNPFVHKGRFLGAFRGERALAPRVIATGGPSCAP